MRIVRVLVLRFHMFEGVKDVLSSRSPI